VISVCVCVCVMVNVSCCIIKVRKIMCRSSLVTRDVCMCLCVMNRYVYEVSYEWCTVYNPAEKVSSAERRERERKIERKKNNDMSRRRDYVLVENQEEEEEEKKEPSHTCQKSLFVLTTKKVVSSK